MAESRDKKILRIGLIQNGKIVEERLLRRREAVTIGQSPRNTFIISSVAGLPKSYPLFEIKSGTYQLNFRAGMNGKVSVGDAVYDFKTLREQKRARKRGDGYIVELSEKSRGKVVFGDVVILFQFVPPPPPPSKLQLPASLKGSIAQRMDWPYVTALMASFALQVFSLAYIVNQDYPEPPRVFESLPEQWVQQLQAPKKKLPEPKPDDKKKKEKEDEKSKEKQPKKKAPKVVVKKPPKEEPKEETVEQKSRKEAKRLRKMQKEVRSKTILKFFGTKDGDRPADVAGILDDDGAPDVAMKDAFSGDGIMVANKKGMARDRRIGSTKGKAKGIGKGALKTRRGSVASSSKGKEKRVKGKARFKKPDEAIGSGILDQSKITKVVRRRMSQLRSCYENCLKNNPKLRGVVKVEWTIQPSGRVGNVRIRRNTTGDKKLERCIIKKVKRFRFAKPDGGSLTVAYPFVFEPRG